MARVLAIEQIRLDAPQPVYNFTVRGPHTYFVLDVGVLVHNDKERSRCNLLEQIILATWGHPAVRKAEETLEGFIQRAFGGDEELFHHFVRKLDEMLPKETVVVARGSSITGFKWTSGRPFDWRGQGTSDLDLVLMGDSIIKEWRPGEFKIPGLYTANLGDDTPYIAPRLNPLRMELQEMIGRPVNIQAANRTYMDVRHFVQRKPYLVLLSK